MNYKMVGRYISLIFAIEGVFMLPALILSFADGDFGAGMAFVYTILIIAAVSGGLTLLCRNRNRGFYAREGMVCVGVSWLLISVAGCLPFCISGVIPSFIDALFETVSGFTTTGATILTEIESLPRGLLYWRSFSHWLGGMGVLIFMLAIVPEGGRSGYTIHLMRAESTGPSVGKLAPRMRQTALILYTIYIALTVLNLVFLLFGGMPFFDAICTAFGTAGTGGFGIKNDSIAGYSTYIQGVCTVFMLLFGVNFSCYYLLLLGDLKSVLKNSELKMYFGVAAVSIIIITLNIRGMYPGIFTALHHAAFQVSSIMTTTGFATADFDMWPSFSKAILLMLMIIGACAGSTGGGFKCGRIMLLLKSMRRSIRKTLRPQKVEVIQMEGQIVDEEIISRTNAYLCAYAVIIMLSFLAVSLDGFSVTTNISAVVACFNNIGPGLEMVGPVGNFAGFSAFSKAVLIFDMLAGRLEIFPILILFSRSTWRKA